MVIKLSASFGDDGMLSVELAVSAHGVLVCLGTVGSLFSLLFVSLQSLLEVAPDLLLATACCQQSDGKQEVWICCSK